MWFSIKLQKYLDKKKIDCVIFLSQKERVYLAYGIAVKIMNKLCIIMLSAVTAVLSLGASEPMSYNELESASDSYWDTTGRTGVTVEVGSCEFSGGLDISPHDIQWSGDFDLCTMKRGLVFIVH